MSYPPHLSRFGATAMALALAFNVIARADTAIELNNWSGGNIGNFMVGYTFTVDYDIEVTSLGKYDFSTAGLNEAAMVGIWNDSSGALITSTLVDSTVGTLHTDAGPANGWYSVGVTPTTLTSGNTYVIGTQSFAGGEAFAFNASISTGAGINYGQGRFNSGSTFARPTTAAGANSGNAYFGPNFEYTAVTAPESVSLNSLVEYQVVQRDEANNALLNISGTIAGSSSQVEARLVDFVSGTPVGAWTEVDSSVGDGTFAGTLDAGTGWYRVEVRGTDGVTEFASVGVDRVGVGDVYITAGQSNSANHGSPRQSADSDLVAARTSVSNNTWQHADDPEPIATGTGGSAWPQLGDLMVDSNGVPVGFVNVGVGATSVSQWEPGTTNYDTRLKTAIESLMTEGGFRAILWHQGETDSLNSTDANTYATRLQSIIDQSRVDAGWDVVWGIAEASYHPNSTQTQEEAVAAGQRLVAFGDTLVFLGPRTDDFSLEGKLSDGVHFNATGLNDHAQQWADALNGVYSLVPKNGGFESQTLADGGVIGGRVIGWNELSASGLTAADGTNGVYNPSTAFYSNPAAAGIEGVNVAFLNGGSAGKSMLQTLDAVLEANTTYTLTIALGVRDVGTAVFGDYDIDLLAGGVALGDGISGTLATLNVLAGGDASGRFTDVTYVFTTGDTVGMWQNLAIRVTKVNGGTGTYLDFDNVRLTAAASVPAPAALPLGLLMLAGMAATRRRRSV